MRRVAFVVGTLSTGGIERTVADLSLFLQKNGWQPAVICVIKKSGPFLKVLQDNNIEVYECKLNSRWFVWRFQKLLKSIEPDVLHSHVAFSMPWQVIGAKLAGIKNIIWTQQNEYQNWRYLFSKIRIRFYFLLFFRFIKHYTCVSERVRSSLSELVGISADRLKVIPNGVDTIKFYPNKEIREMQRKMLLLDEDTFVIGHVARFSEQKGHKYLVQGINILVDKHPGIMVVLVGVGPLQNEIRSEVERLNLTNNFIFFGRGEVERIMQSFDCFILPSLWEGMPLALLEAMATGLPVIGSDVAGTREVISNGVNGLLIPPRNPEEIAKAISTLIENPDHCKIISQNALAVARDKYSVASNALSYIELYD